MVSNESLQKKALYGPDVNLDEFKPDLTGGACLSDLEHIPEDTKRTLEMVGIDPKMEKRSGTYIQNGNMVDFCFNKDQDVMIMPIPEALQKYDWLKDYLWKAVDPEADKYTAAVAIEKNIEDHVLVNLEPILTKIDAFFCSGNRKTKALYRYITKMKNLDTLFLEDNVFSDDDCMYIANLLMLETLGLKNNNISGSCFSNLKNLKNISTLDLSGNPIKDEHLKHFEHLPKLRMIDLNNTPVTDKALDIIANFKSEELVGVSAIGTKVTKKAAQRFYEKRRVEVCVSAKECNL
jgi:disulfide oxidoreductase YuzD